MARSDEAFLLHPHGTTSAPRLGLAALLLRLELLLLVLLLLAQTGVTALCLAGQSRGLPTQTRKRRATSERRSSGWITASTTISEARCRMSISAAYSARSFSTWAARSSGSSMA